MPGGFSHAGARDAPGAPPPRRQPARPEGVRKGSLRLRRGSDPARSHPRRRRGNRGSPRKSANGEPKPRRRADRQQVPGARAARHGPSPGESSTLPTGRLARRAFASRAPAPSRPPLPRSRCRYRAALSGAELPPRAATEEPGRVRGPPRRLLLLLLLSAAGGVNPGACPPSEAAAARAAPGRAD